MPKEPFTTPVGSGITAVIPFVCLVHFILKIIICFLILRIRKILSSHLEKERKKFCRIHFWGDCFHRFGGVWGCVIKLGRLLLIFITVLVRSFHGVFRKRVHEVWSPCTMPFLCVTLNCIQLHIEPFLLRKISMLVGLPIVLLQ